ncbi:Threonine synthase [Talaromyces atroroseus]|uniref:Threonine synthase n=1 Tax=Talaromyces atroroseus TaxID=1441469 RepID=A0A1Q5QCA0_TALAT|nr:Threonine synthase [Talaromyces atroroseus]OKL63448.1 Threonine synthase [Talaromyces atroroseus]
MIASFLSTRGGSYGVSFEEAVLQGLAPDGGLFVPESIPSLPCDWNNWVDLSFEELAFEILTLYIPSTEIPHQFLKAIIHQAYASFRVPDVTPTITLDNERKIHLLELFHGPTFAFKDIALQFFGNLLEFFLERRNQTLQKAGQDREHYVVVGATSGDTGSAGIEGLRGKKDVSVFVLFPTGRVSSVQEAQMTTVPDANVHCLSVDGTFDDCQGLLKGLFADRSAMAPFNLTSINSINVSRILAQVTFYFASYFSLVRSGKFNPSSDQIKFSVPTGNFGDILAGFLAKRMGLPISQLIVATNENDILHRFWQTGTYEKLKSTGSNTHAGAVKETMSPAMDVLISSNFERLLWFLAYDVYGSEVDGEREKLQVASSMVRQWQAALKSEDRFSVEQKMLNAARAEFSSQRVSDAETLATIHDVYQWTGLKHYVLDPHSAIGVTAAIRSAEAAPSFHHVALSTAHPAKFSHAVELALSEEQGFLFSDILPPQLSVLEKLPRRVIHVKRRDGLDGVRKIIMEEVGKVTKT